MHDQPAHDRRRHRPHRRAHRAAGLILAALLLGTASPAAAVPQDPPPSQRVLATGDSMMYVIQQPLKRRLLRRGYEVKVDGLFGTGITKPWILDWPKHARAQVREFHPDVTVVWIGAGDSFALGGHECCGVAWRERYKAEVRKMIAIYGRTIWMTLPAPREPSLARIFRGVNRAVREAVAGRAELLDLVPVFTPGWRYRDTMLWNGRMVSVRQSDGVHLGFDGVGIGANLVVDALT